MSGKAYTMREMKAIVEYLTEHRAYRELKGRKMWMDYANSNLTIRTWQSLKETFLKRILPDITNPYYKLTVQQIASFQQGCDIEKKLNNKLEIESVEEDSTSNDSQDKNRQSPNKNNEQGANEAGEGPQSPTLNEQRSSVETVVIENCYNTADDIRKELESPVRQKPDSPKTTTKKSIRDCFTYSEPLTPALQEVLHDFQTDEEEDGSDKEPRMEIVEAPDTNNGHDSAPIVIPDSENNDNTEENKNQESDKSKDLKNKESKNQTKTKQSEVQHNTEPECIDITDDTPETNASDITDKDKDNPDVPLKDVEKTVQVVKDSQPQDTDNPPLSTTDTLPNNQEAFKELCNVRESSLNKQHSKQLSNQSNKSDSRKRSHSQDVQSNKKRLCSEKVVRPSSDVDSAKQKKHNIADKKIEKHKEKISNKTKTSDNDKNPKESTSKRDSSPLNKSDNSSIADNHHLSNENVTSKPSRTTHSVTPKNVQSEKASTSSESGPKMDKDTRKRPRDEKESNKQKDIPDTHIEKVNDIVILQSHSDSSSDHVMISPKKKKKISHTEPKVHRDKALANVFGFSSGMGPRRKKQIKHRQRLPSNQTINSSDSEGWTSDSETEFISPPRGRKDKAPHTRKYLKPKAARILSLEQEGGLFVMYGKKVYPLVKDGKIVKNYVTCSPDHSDDEEAFWKLKYVEEKKKTDELTKLLAENKKPASIPTESEIPPVQQPVITEKSVTSTEVHTKPQPVSEPTKKDEASEAKTVKIKFTKNNEEVQLEGHWSHVHPVLEHLVNILHKDENVPKEMPAIIESDKSKGQGTSEREVLDNAKSSTKIQKTSRGSTPLSTITVDEDVKDKVNKMEEEIFKEIQARENTNKNADDVSATSNVTVRKTGRPRKQNSKWTTERLESETNGAEGSKAKKSKVSTDNAKAPDNQLLPSDEANNNTGMLTRRKSRTSKTSINGKGDKANDGKRVTRGSIQESQIKYKFPSPSTTNKNVKVNTKKKSKETYSVPKPARIYSPSDTSLNSIESSLYQDSDVSDVTIGVRKKRRSSLITLKKRRPKSKRISIRTPLCTSDLSSDLSLSFVTAPVKVSSPSSSLSKENYRSESYELMFPQKMNPLKHLQTINENSPVLNKTYCINNSNNVDPMSDLQIGRISLNNNDMVCSSSTSDENFSQTLPSSPVLSTIEKISVSKDKLKCFNDMDTDIMEPKTTVLNEFMELDVDMALPLMEQDFPSSGQNRMELGTSDDNSITQSLIHQVREVQIEKPPLSDSIHQKLKDLLLESAKKIAIRINKGENQDVENKMDICESQEQVKTKSKKRCSTPRKRKSKRNLMEANQEVLVMQEHTESYGNRKSAPTPVLVVTDAEGTNKVATDNSETKISMDDNTKPKKKKDVIKVKIQKPKMKKPLDDTMQKRSKSSLQTDSAINDTESGIFLQACEDDSIELIHNHSDTCIQAKECVDNMEKLGQASSIMSHNSKMPLKELKISKSLNGNQLLDIHCEDAQDTVYMFAAPETVDISGNSDINISSNSLLTEDLSDEPIVPEKSEKQGSKWYLLSEEETSNTNFVDTALNQSNRGAGSHLDQIFPITCAVPDLSTITEEHTAGNTGFNPQRSPNFEI